jgi:hypothetical protein
MSATPARCIPILHVQPVISVESLSRLCRADVRASDTALNRSAEPPEGAGAGASQARYGDHPAIVFLAPPPWDCQAMPAAKPTKIIIKTRAKANENGLLSHNRTLVIRFRMVARRRGLLDDSAAGRLLDNSDIVIGIPPYSCAGGKNWCQPTIVRKPFRFATGFDRLPSTIPMTVNSVQLSGNQGTAFGSPLSRHHPRCRGAVHPKPLSGEQFCTDGG